MFSLSSGFTASSTPQQAQNSHSLNVDFDSVFGNNTNVNNLDSTGEFRSPLSISWQTSFTLPPRGHHQPSLLHFEWFVRLFCAIRAVNEKLIKT